MQREKEKEEKGEDAKPEANEHAAKSEDGGGGGDDAASHYLWKGFGDLRQNQRGRIIVLRRV